MTYYSAIELTNALIRQKRRRSNTSLCSSAGLQSFSIVGRRYSAGSSRRFSPFFSDRFERRGLVYVGADINNPAQTQATNGSGYWQSHGCVPAQGSGRGYTSENARFEDTHFQSGTDLVGADWEPTLSVANGQPVSQTDALNNTTSYTYNSLGKVLTVTDAENNVTSYTYNLLGQMTSLTDPEGNATAWTYDSMGRVVSETNEKNAVRSYEYDDLGRLIQTTDRNGRVIQYEYDYLGRQTAEKWLDSNSAVIGSILYTFDGNNNLLTVTDSISGTDYEYRYDALNRCVYTKVDSDGLNAPVEFTYSYNTSDLTVTETLTGLINGVVAPYYQNVYQYDVFGRLESISQTGTGLTAKSVDYVYNLNGQRVSAEYQQNGETVSESAWVYDVTGKVSSIQHKTALDAVFAEYNFTWDAGNRIIEIDSTDGTAEYTYDKTGQLTGADYDYITDELYTYDSNGNRTNAGYVTGENNETLSDGVYRYSYDNEGNRTEKFLWTDSNNDGIIDASEKTLVQTYEWDYRNRLSSVTNYENGIAKEVINYLYDYLNLMIERTVTDATTSILQSSDFNIYSNGQIILEYDTTSSVDVVKTVNLWGANIDELVAVEKMAQNVNDSNVILWTYGDHLNSIRDVLIYDSIDQTAAVVNHLIYNAFGILVSSTDGAANPVSISPLLNYRYTGKFFDDSTGLQNNINRWYDNTIGKWISVDPIGFKGGDANLYRYVRNNSSQNRDIDGLYAISLEEFKNTKNDILQDKIKQIIDELRATGQLKTDKNDNYIIPIPNTGEYAIIKRVKHWFSSPMYMFVGSGIDADKRKEIAYSVLREATSVIDKVYKIFDDFEYPFATFYQRSVIKECLCKYYRTNDKQTYDTVKEMVTIIYNGLHDTEGFYGERNISLNFNVKNTKSGTEILATRQKNYFEREILVYDNFFKYTPKLHHRQLYSMIHEFHHFYLAKDYDWPFYGTWSFNEGWEYGSSDEILRFNKEHRDYRRFYYLSSDPSTKDYNLVHLGFEYKIHKPPITEDIVSIEDLYQHADTFAGFIHCVNESLKK